MITLLEEKIAYGKIKDYLNQILTWRFISSQKINNKKKKSQ